MAPGKTRSRLSENLALALGSLVISLALLGLAEGTLCLTGLGAPDPSRASRLRYQQIFLPILEPGERPDGTPVLHTVDPRLPYQSVLRDKPADALRVVTFGGSATAGLGFSPNVTFARELERMLRQAYADRHVEVVNLGIVALPSRQVRILVEEVCRRYQPDAVIVYSGNNEFLEIHAEKFALAHGSVRERVGHLLSETHLYRALRQAVRGPPEAPSLAERELSSDDLRVSQDRIIEDIDLGIEEVAEIVDAYADSLHRLAAAAAETQTPLVLMAVASNWKYRGREDLPEGWLDELLGDDSSGSAAQRYQRAREALEEKVASSDPKERWDWRFRLAVVQEALGEYAGAREGYREAMNEDPHLRRALDSMNDRVREVAERHGAQFVDSVEVLAAQARHGIVGFDEFYDYVHFTPRGAAVLASAAFRSLVEAGVVPKTQFAPDAFAHARIERYAALEADPLEFGEWMGFGFDPARVHDRDLWKYDRLLRELDERLEARPDDVRALVYRGNAYAFRVGGAARAAQDYRSALALPGAHARVVQANLDRLLALRRP